MNTGSELALSVIATRCHLSQRERPWQYGKVSGFAKGSPFGGAGANAPERARPLPKRMPFMKHTTVNKNYTLLSTARALRRNLTPQEHKLWYAFLRNYPIKIYKQRIIESFIVDFYCAEARLVIELDGSQHYTEQGKAYDAERSAILQQYDLFILRFANNDVDNHFNAVCEQIHATIQNRI